MKKEEVILVVIFLLIALAGIAGMIYLEASGKAWELAQPSYVPAPAPLPGIPVQRIAILTETRKPELSPEAAYYLQQGRYTTPIDEIKQIKIKPISTGGAKEGETTKPWEQNKAEFNQIRGIFKFLDNFPTYKEEDDTSWSLTVNDIFKKGLNENYCGQYGRMFVALARNTGIPAKYLQAYSTGWSTQQKKQGCWDGKTSGHVYAQVYVDGNWYGIDPAKRIFTDIFDKKVLDSQGNTKAVIFAEGRDHGDILPYLHRWCLEGLRYHKAIPGLLLCPGTAGPEKNQLRVMLACSKPLQLVEFQKKR
ncbi:hypothetical protein GF343_04085 [Candidatus Woesearchaeota archaeon]|nr:hypothetical protein [Candidatus Woesearchaeota archaeon]